MLLIFHVVGDSFHPTGTWSSHNKKWRSFRCRSGGYILCVFVRFSISAPNALKCQTVNTDISSQDFASRCSRCSGFFSVETADTLPVAHASWSSCDRILREKAQIIRGSGENAKCLEQLTIETGLESCFQTIREMLTR